MNSKRLNFGDQTLEDRNALIVERIKAGEKRYLIAEEYGLTKNAISIVSRKAGLPAYSRFKRVVETE